MSVEVKTWNKNIDTEDHITKRIKTKNFIKTIQKFWIKWFPT